LFPVTALQGESKVEPLLAIRCPKAVALVRSNAGYRSYSDNDVERLKFIKRSRELGFSVIEITDLLDLWNNRKVICT